MVEEVKDAFVLYGNVEQREVLHAEAAKILMRDDSVPIKHMNGISWLAGKFIKILSVLSGNQVEMRAWMGLGMIVELTRAALLACEMKLPHQDHKCWFRIEGQAW